MLLLEVILCSLNDHTHIADLLGLVQYISNDGPSSPGKKVTSARGVHDNNDDFLLKLRTSETLMKMLLRNMAFFTVSCLAKKTILNYCPLLLQRFLVPTL